MNPWIRIVLLVISGIAILKSIFCLWFIIRWSEKMHPNTSLTLGWWCFWNKHQLVIHQRIDAYTGIYWCERCSAGFEVDLRARYAKPWTKDTQQFYTTMNHRIRPLPDAGVQPRKLHGGGAS